MLDKKKLLKLLIGYGVLAGLFLLYWKLRSVAPELHYRFVQGEDKAAEWITFFGFLGGAMACWMTLRFRAQMGWKGMGFFGMLGLFFFVCAGEEISWGQRVFGFETPDAMLEVNEQEEFNLHNLSFEHLHPKDIVSWSMKLFGIVLPLFFVWPRVRERWDPGFRYIPPVAIVPVFVLPELINLFEDGLSAWVASAMGPFDPAIPGFPRELRIPRQSEELIEMYWGLAVFFACVALYRAWKRFAEDSRLESPAEATSVEVD
ncbi:MAG: hypothetical protein PHF14_10165 [Verrucomicrobiota bacterium]|nr:hypothetical protein [Verrucomicrobiota bacterium]MDI9385593.1 hypothetical protein [Verrucomicrobiota bacterium]